MSNKEGEIKSEEQEKKDQEWSEDDEKVEPKFS